MFVILVHYLNVYSWKYGSAVEIRYHYKNTFHANSYLRSGLQ